MKMVTYQEPEFEVAGDELSSVIYLEHGSSSSLVRWHCHEEYELHLISSSHGKVFIGDFVGNFSPGHIVLTGPNLPHNWISDKDCIDAGTDKVRDKVVKFSQSVFDRLNEVMPELRELTALLRASAYGLEFDSTKVQMYEPMFDAVRDSQGVARIVHFFSLMQALDKDEHRIQLSSREFCEQQPVTNVHLVNKAIQYISQNYTRALSLSDVSEYVGMPSPSGFSRFFHKATGIKYIEFIKKLRVSKACERLEKSNDQITQICFDVGFANVANFNRHFLAIKGMTPRQYRERCQQKFSVSTLKEQ